MTISPGERDGYPNPSETYDGEKDCEIAGVVTPDLVRALDDLCALAREMEREQMAEQCALWAQQFRSVLEMDAESQRKALSELWLG